jgi:regulator of sigma E protease
VYDHEGDKADTVYLSESSGLMSEDKIIKVGSTRVHTGYEVAYEIMNQGYRAVDITVERNGVVTVVEDVVFPTVVENGMAIGAQDFLLYSYSKDTVRFGDYIHGAFWRSCSTVKMVWDSLAGLFSGRYGMEAVSGPIGVTEVITDAAKTDHLSLLYIVTVITINLGVMNLLPFPALDGGHLLIYLVEAVVRKPIPKKIEGLIHLAGFAVLMILMVLIATKDIVGLVERWLGGN